MPSIMKTGIDLNGQRAQNAADPSTATDLTTKQYVDNKIDGLSYKDEVRVATTGNGTLATAYANGQTIDGQVLATNDRILVKDQSTGSENGIYKVNAAGAPTRTTDADSTAELNNATVYVLDGTVNAGREYTQTAKNPTVNTTSLVFVQKSTGTSYLADGQGIELTSTTFSIELDGSSLSKSATGIKVANAFVTAMAGAGLVEASQVLAVGAGTGITVNANDIAIDPTVVNRKFAANCVVTTNPQTFNHALNNADAQVQVVEVATKRVVYADVTLTDANNVSVDFGAAPTSAQYRVAVQG